VQDQGVSFLDSPTVGVGDDDLEIGLASGLALTSTAFFIGKPIGLSTLFGAAGLGSKEFAVGVRVTWHFVMNLLPMPFAMMGLMEYWDEHRPARLPAPAWA